MELSDGAKAALSKVVESSATALADTIDSSGKIVKDNVKELAAEIILFKGYVEYGTGLALSSLILFAIRSGIMFLTDLNISERTDSGLRYFGIAVLYAIGFGISIWLIDCVVNICKAKFATRLFLVEYASSLLKKESSSSK